MSFDALLPSTMAAVLAFGLALGIARADGSSPTTRVLFLALFAAGLAMLGTPFIDFFPDDQIPSWLRLHAAAEAVSLAAFGLWVWRVARTAPNQRRAMQWISAWTCVQLGAMVAYFLLCQAFPAARSNHFIAALGREQFFTDPQFWILAAPFAIGMVAFIASCIVMFRMPIDAAERLRAVAFAVQAPFLTAALVLPVGIHALSMTTGMLLFAVSSLRYYIEQGERAQFMSKFLSPQVAELVRHRGFDRALQPRSLDITAVHCDLRGFTYFAEHHSSEFVIGFLGRYYEVVGSVVAEFGATIKDYAGDGVMILVGAPVAQADHAEQGLQLAVRLRAELMPLVAEWQHGPTPLGAGIGIASGRVTAGALGSASRLEYSAVGSTINLAARLCSSADDGEILVDVRTAEQSGHAAAIERRSLDLKGIGIVDHYVLATMRAA